MRKGGDHGKVIFVYIDVMESYSKPFSGII